MRDRVAGKVEGEASTELAWVGVGVPKVETVLGDRPHAVDNRYRPHESVRFRASFRGKTCQSMSSNTSGVVAAGAAAVAVSTIWGSSEGAMARLSGCGRPLGDMAGA